METLYNSNADYATRFILARRQRDFCKQGKECRIYKFKNQGLDNRWKSMIGKLIDDNRLIIVN